MKLPPSAAASGDELAARRPAQGKFDIAYGALLTTQPGSTSARGWASPSRVKRETMVASKASWDIAVHRLPAHRHSCLRSGCCGQRLAPEAAHAARWPPSGSSVVPPVTLVAQLYNDCLHLRRHEANLCHAVQELVAVMLVQHDAISVLAGGPLQRGAAMSCCSSGRPSEAGKQLLHRLH